MGDIPLKGRVERVMKRKQTLTKPKGRDIGMAFAAKAKKKKLVKTPPSTRRRDKKGKFVKGKQ